MKMATVPNLICVLRIALTVPIVILLVEERYGQTLVLFAIAAVSDVLDGYLAKTFGWTSDVGKWLDPLADKLSASQNRMLGIGSHVDPIEQDLPLHPGKGDPQRLHIQGAIGSEWQQPLPLLTEPQMIPERRVRELIGRLAPERHWDRVFSG